MILYIIRGLPGSGKSELAERLAPDSHYAADDYFVGKDGVYRFNKNYLTKAHQTCYKNVENAMMNGDEVIAVANTFTTKAEYTNYIMLAEKLGYRYCEIICKGEFQSRHDIPSKTVQNMVERFEF